MESMSVVLSHYIKLISKCPNLQRSQTHTTYTVKKRNITDITVHDSQGLNKHAALIECILRKYKYIVSYITPPTLLTQLYYTEPDAFLLLLPSVVQRR